jgi:hypothetical protein
VASVGWVGRSETHRYFFIGRPYTILVGEVAAARGGSARGIGFRCAQPNLRPQRSRLSAGRTSLKAALERHCEAVVVNPASHRTYPEFSVCLKPTIERRRAAANSQARSVIPNLPADEVVVRLLGVEPNAKICPPSSTKTYMCWTVRIRIPGAATVIIAQRSLTINDSSGDNEVQVRLFRPEDDNGMWICRYEIDWPGQKRSYFAGGVDAVQALNRTGDMASQSAANCVTC